MSLEFYRRKQRVVLAILVLVAIFSFIIVPSIQLYQSNRSEYGVAGNDAVVVSWDSRKVKRSELGRWVQSHGQTVNFLGQVAVEVLKRGGVPSVPGFLYDPQDGRIRSLGIPSELSSQQVIRNHLYADKAKKMGIEFDDAAIDLFVSDFVNGKLSRDELKQIMDQVSGGTLTRFRLYEQLKISLAANTVDQLGFSGFFASPNSRTGGAIASPAQAFRNYLRANQQAKIEAFPILVSDYIAKVTETPTESQINELYEKYKNNDAFPESATPGFHRAYAAELELVELDLEKLLTEETAKFTEEQLKAEYDRRVAAGQYRITAPVTPTGVPGPETAVPGATTPTSEPPATEPTTSPAASGETPAAAPTTPEATTPPATEPPPATGTETAPATPAAPETPAAEPTAPPANPQSRNDGAKGGRNQVRLVSFQDPAAPVAEPVATQPPATETPAAPAAETPATAPETPASGSAVPPTVDAPPGLEDAAQAPTVPSSPPAPQIRPFEEVKNEIARDLAFAPARDRLQKAKEPILAAMNAYRDEYVIYEGRKSAQDAEAKEPVEKRPDIKKLAETAGLKYRKIDLSSQVAIQNDPIARSVTLPQGQPFTQLVYRPQAPKFEAIEAFAFPSGEYLAWKSADRMPFTPTLEECREEVIAAWKKEKAEKLAIAAAEELIAKAKVAANPADVWKEILDEPSRALLVAPAAFPWYRVEQFQQSVTFPVIDKVDTAGEEFMAGVFGTTPGSFGIAPNQPKTIVYVVKLLELTPSSDDLLQKFLSEPNQGASATLVNNRQGSVLFSDWQVALQKEMGFKFESAADQLDE